MQRVRLVALPAGSMPGTPKLTTSPHMCIRNQEPPLKQAQVRRLKARIQRGAICSVHVQQQGWREQRRLRGGRVKTSVLLALILMECGAAC